MTNFRYDSAEAREAANKNLGKLMDNVSVVCFVNSLGKKTSIVLHGFVTFMESLSEQIKENCLFSQNKCNA